MEFHETKVIGPDDKRPEMNTKSEIEDTIRAALPIVFGKSESVVAQDFRTRFHALTDFAASASEPVLRAETVRYQSILVYWSLILLTLHFFKVGTLKIGEAAVKVDQKLFIIFSIFLLTVAAVFLVKAYVDYQRTIFIREKNVSAMQDLGYLITIGRARRRIQEHFWTEIYNAIGRTYKTYADARATVLGNPANFENFEFSSSLDLGKLSEVPELKMDIEAQTKLLASIKIALAKDEERLKTQIGAITLDRPTDDDPLFTPSEHKQHVLIRTAFDQCLEHWFAARNTLTSEHLKTALGNSDIERMLAMQSIIQRTSTIRKMYALLEVAMPVAFAVVSTAYIWTAPTAPAGRSATQVPRQIIDLSPTITEDLPARLWGRRALKDFGFTETTQFRLVQRSEPTYISNAYWTLMNHAGPHVDAPNHLERGAAGADSYRLESLVGSIKFVDLRGAADQPIAVGVVLQIKCRNFSYLLLKSISSASKLRQWQFWHTEICAAKIRRFTRVSGKSAASAKDLKNRRRRIVLVNDLLQIGFSLALPSSSISASSFDLNNYILESARCGAPLKRT